MLWYKIIRMVIDIKMGWEIRHHTLMFDQLLILKMEKLVVRKGIIISNRNIRGNERKKNERI